MASAFPSSLVDDEAFLPAAFAEEAAKALRDGQQAVAEALITLAYAAAGVVFEDIAEHEPMRYQPSP